MARSRARDKVMFYAPWPENYLTRSQSGSNKMSHIGPSCQQSLSPHTFSTRCKVAFTEKEGGKSHNKHVSVTDTLLTHRSKIPQSFEILPILFSLGQF